MEEIVKQSIVKIVANNHEHNLPQLKRCECGDDMKLKLEEDTCGNVTYKYLCLFRDCDIVEVIDEEC